MKHSLKLLLINLLFITHYTVNAQNIGMNPTGATPHASALVDIDATGGPALGLLIPRIALTAINVAAPVTSPATSLLVYNTAIANTGTLAVSPGYYYWDGAKWVRFAFSASGSSAFDWNTLGNTGTVDGTNFIGTIDNVPFDIRVNNQKAGRVDNILNNTFFGYQAANSTTTGSLNVAIGANALSINSVGNQVTAVGAEALMNNTASLNTAIGSRSMRANTTGNGNTAVGLSSLRNNTTGSYNNAFGQNALTSNTNGQYNVAMGNGALVLNTSGSFNVGMGSASLDTNTTGAYNVAIGHATLRNNQTGNYNTAVGHTAGTTNSIVLNGSRNTYLGAAADATGTFTNATAIGYNAKVGQSNALVLGGTGADAVNVGIGTATPLTKFQIETPSGFQTLLHSSFSGPCQIAFGNRDSQSALLNGGLGAYSSIVAANGNLHFGLTEQVNPNNMQYTTFATITNTGNVGIGTTTPAYKLDVVGTSSLPSAGGILHVSSTSGPANLHMGVDNSVSGGEYSWIQSHGTRPLYINNTNHTILNLLSSNVGIGTNNPTEKLEVQGSVKIVDGTQGAGKVLTSDASGKGSWEAPQIINSLIPSTYTISNTGATYTGVSVTITKAGYYKIGANITSYVANQNAADFAIYLSTSSSSNSIAMQAITDLHYIPNSPAGSYMQANAHSFAPSFLNIGTYYYWMSAGNSNTNIVANPHPTNFASIYLSQQ